MALLNADLSLSILNLTNNQDQANALYVENDMNTEGDKLELTLKNKGEPIKFFAATADVVKQGTPGANNYTFSLVFQPSDILSQGIAISIRDENGDFIKTDTNESNWTTNITTNNTSEGKGLVIIYFLHSSELTLEKNIPIEIGLLGIKPDNNQSRSSHVELRIPTKDQLETYFCQTFLNIIKHQGVKTISLKASINNWQIRNDGEGQSVIIRLTNRGKEINFNKSNVQVYWDTQGSNALTSQDQVPQTINVQTEQSRETISFSPAKKEDPDKGLYEILDFSFKLDSKGVLVIIIDNLKTTKPVGPSIIKINYSNVDGYWDGTLELPVMLTSRIEVNNNLWIGFNEEERKNKIILNGAQNEKTVPRLALRTANNQDGLIIDSPSAGRTLLPHSNNWNYITGDGTAIRNKTGKSILDIDCAKETLRIGEVASEGEKAKVTIKQVKPNTAGLLIDSTAGQTWFPYVNNWNYITGSGTVIRKAGYDLMRIDCDSKNVEIGTQTIDKVLLTVHGHATFLRVECKTLLVDNIPILEKLNSLSALCIQQGLDLKTASIVNFATSTSLKATRQALRETLRILRNDRDPFYHDRFDQNAIAGLLNRLKDD